MNSVQVPHDTDTTCRRPIQWRSCAVTHTGMVRELNEDAVLECGEYGHWAVADGMGGHKVGDVASAEIIRTLEGVASPGALADAVDAVEDGLLAVNQRLRDYARNRLEGATVGSTLVDLVVRGRLGVCLWAGDSRLYRYRKGELIQINRDHSQVEDMVQMGLLSREAARVHQCSNVITRAIGVEETLLLDCRVFDVQVGDLLLLCSDGLHGVLEPSHIAGVLADRDPDGCAQQLLDTVLKAGAPDNVSLIVIKGEPGRPGQTAQTVDSHRRSTMR